MRALLGATLTTLVGLPSAQRPYLEASRDTARWLEATAVQTEHGLVWPVEPAASERSDLNLYSGTPGVVLFLIELHGATGDEDALAAARAGADHLAATLPDAAAETDVGLYTGIAGRGFVLLEAWRATGEDAHREAAVRCAQAIHAAAVETEHGVRWTDVTDVIGGAAGTGLFLLDCAERLDRPQDRELAARAGRQLIAVARDEQVGRAWGMTPNFPRTMPNFSHGTAGVAYFLAELHAATGDAAFLESAIDGARHLEELADRSEGGFRVHHNTPRDPDLYYLGWCHGPPGTARLFERLAQVTGEDEWRSRVAECALAVRASGVPEQRTDGFWNNVGQCCGSAGVAEFALDLGQLDFARALADDVLRRSARTEQGVFWIQAEHRIRPELLQAQTGYMQGAAGVGMLLLHLDGVLHERGKRIRLPDDPF